MPRECRVAAEEGSGSGSFAVDWLFLTMICPAGMLRAALIPGRSYASETMFNRELIESATSHYTASQIDQEISPNDLMNNQWYFDVGRSAVEVIAAAMMSSYVNKVDRILDLPCAHGRVLRHLAAMFPRATLHACDLDTDGVEFCARKYGAVPMHSKPELTEMDFGTEFDLIWVGSLFTHVAEDQTARWLAHLARFLSPTGIVVATTHGRWSEHVHQRSPYIGADRWETVMKGYRDRGYGYADYVAEESSQYLPGNYGISMSRAAVIVDMIERIEGVRLFSYTERAWADHQDVVVYGKPGYAQAWG
jgi:SAM-dependent methyltransferase